MRVSFSSQLRLPPPRYSPSTNSSPAASRSESARTAAEISSSDTQLTQQNLARASWNGNSALLARQLEADFFIMATDADAVFLDWGKPSAKAFRRAPPKAMHDYSF